MLRREKKILIVEDDKDISRLIEYNFTRNNFICDSAFSGEEGLLKASKKRYDLIILDLMLPGVGGLEICKKLKQEEKTKEIPIVILTAKGEEIDRIVGFELGAEDYVVKPFSPRELILRVKAILKRGKLTSTDEKNIYKHNSIVVDTLKHLVVVNKKEIQLTPIEFSLLIIFLKRKGRLQTRDVLLSDVWGIDAYITTRTVDTHIKRLRQKLGQAGECIQTIRGMGYKCI